LKKKRIKENVDKSVNMDNIGWAWGFLFISFLCFTGTITCAVLEYKIRCKFPFIFYDETPPLDEGAGL
jgi:hypothetical protein